MQYFFYGCAKKYATISVSLQADVSTFPLSTTSKCILHKNCFMPCSSFFLGVLLQFQNQNYFPFFSGKQSETKQRRNTRQKLQIYNGQWTLNSGHWSEQSVQRMTIPWQFPKSLFPFPTFYLPLFISSSPQHS